jgi:hypothetical protein
MIDKVDGKLGPRTLRAIRDHLAIDAERKIIRACLESGHFDSLDEIHALLDHVKAGAP